MAGPHAKECDGCGTLWVAGAADSSRNSNGEGGLGYIINSPRAPEKFGMYQCDDRNECNGKGIECEELYPHGTACAASLHYIRPAERMRRLAWPSNADPVDDPCLKSRSS